MTLRKRSSLLSFIGRAAITVAIAAVIFTTASVQAQDSDPVVARVDGRDIRESEIALADRVIGPELSQQVTPEQKRDHLITYVTDMVLMAKEAEARKIPEKAEFARRLAFARDQVLMEMLLQSEGDSAATERAMRRAYRLAVRRMRNLAEMRARHILVEKEEEAQSVVAEIRKGGDFAEIARAKSRDPGSASAGGDLGWFTRDEVTADFAKAAFRLKAGQISRPVKTALGWHVIKVEDRRFRAIPKFEEMDGDVRHFVERTAQTDLVAALRAKARIERLDKPAQPKKK
jgi:peptidyl-prolyl cis-trans isomerase C